VACYPGTLGINVVEMVNMFVNGRKFESIKDSEAVARMTVAFGRVSKWLIVSLVLLGFF